MSGLDGVNDYLLNGGLQGIVLWGVILTIGFVGVEMLGFESPVRSVGMRFNKVVRWLWGRVYECVGAAAAWF
jgi:hypothetical protein